MERPSTVVPFLLSVLVAFGGQSVYAQLADRAEITGIVTDTSGAAVPDAKVSIINQDTGAKIVVGTNSAGNYSTPPLPIGTYTMEVEKEGFKHATHPGIVLSGAQSFRQDVKLEVGAVSEMMTVTGASPLVQTSSSELGTTVQEDCTQALTSWLPPPMPPSSTNRTSPVCTSFANAAAVRIGSPPEKPPIAITGFPVSMMS